MLDVEFAHFSDPGRVRDHNEDYSGYSLPETPEQGETHGWLFALADGVGGQDRGEVASRTAVETVTRGFSAAPTGQPLTALVPRLIQAANTKIVEMHSGGSTMATTFVACALRFDRIVVSHVGDSRCYLIRRGHALALTRDHTVVSEQARLGLISAKEASEATTRHLLSRSLGTGLFVDVDTAEHQVYTDDVVLLCSDGLHGALDEFDIGRVVSHGVNLKGAARDLVALANKRDGGDNISVLLIRILGVERVGMYRGRHYKLR